MRDAGHGLASRSPLMRSDRDTRTVFALQRRFRPHLRPVRATAGTVLALVVLGPLLSAALLWLLKMIIDTVFVARRFDALLALGVAYVGLATAKFGIDYARRRLDAAVSERITQDVRTEVYGHVMALPEPSVTGRGVGELLAHLSSDVERVEYLIAGGPISVVASVAAALFFTTVLFAMNWRLALVALAAVPLLALLVLRRAPTVKRSARVARRYATSWMALAEEALGALPMIHAYQAHAREIERFRARSDAARRAELRSVALHAFLTLLIEIVAVAGGLVVLGVAAYHVQSGMMTLGAVVAFLGSLGSLYEPARDLGQLASRFQRAAAGAHRVADLLDARGAVTQCTNAVRMARARGQIEFRDVRFAYPHGSLVLDRVSFTIAPGEIVAVVGPSGSGKSTLVRLLLRFSDPVSGGVFVDGADLREVTFTSLRANIAVAFQEPFLVQGSIADNVRYGRPDASDAEVAAAMRAAGADEFVHGLRRGSAATVGPRGERLSGGQRQRLALARVFLRDAPILVLDEATAAVDSETEAFIHTSIQRFARRRTIFIVGHRVTTVRQADRVILLEGGRIAEIGTPTALLQQGRRCHDLFVDQLNGAAR